VEVVESEQEGVLIRGWVKVRIGRGKSESEGLKSGRGSN
jgi:hypothetical protein